MGVMLVVGTTDRPRGRTPTSERRVAVAELIATMCDEADGHVTSGDVQRRAAEAFNVSRHQAGTDIAAVSADGRIVRERVQGRGWCVWPAMADPAIRERLYAARIAELEVELALLRGKAAA